MRYLIAETNWTMMTLAQELAAQGVLLTRTDRHEDLPHYARIGGADLAVFDETCLGLDGFSLQDLRHARPGLPIAVIARRPDTKQIARWLNAGADTVIDAATPMAEVTTRLQAVARRAHGVASPLLMRGALSINLDKRRAVLDGVCLHLSPKIYELLEYIALRPGRLVSRDALLSHIYGLNDEPDARVFDVYVCTLRGQLAACDSGIAVETVRGAGFRFVVQTPDVAPARAA